MKVCDRCKQALDTNAESKLAGHSVELCVSCADYILNHIRSYSPKKKGIFQRILDAP